MSHSFKQRIKIGRAISEQMEPVMSADEVAAKLGISRQAVQKTEYLALAKVAILLRELRRTSRFGI